MESLDILESCHFQSLQFLQNIQPPIVLVVANIAITAAT